MKPYDNPFWDFNNGGRKREERREKAMIIVVPSSDRLTACTATLGPKINANFLTLGEYDLQHVCKLLDKTGLGEEKVDEVKKVSKMKRQHY